jgi:hypothetical protein
MCETRPEHAPIKPSSGLWLAIALVFACRSINCLANDSSKHCRIPIVLGNEAMEANVAAALANRSVPYDWIDGVLCADSGAIKSVQDVVSSVVGKELRPGNSASLHKTISEAVKSTLSGRNIPFHEVMFQGANYLVWVAKNSKEVEAVIAEEKERFVKSFSR